ncbi:hypothetical protein BA190_10145 [Labrys sp. WJW]|uniref:hypothetical protein n=1 Tax=Labrys sp. WJW TaxID=1737983 RepID=UPI000834C1D3|nr:hypothetical protein [Labrys sp. WJW]OCC05254.1 hypothetical protein BA190_10145 [Labrys sp. WJW]
MASPFETAGRAAFAALQRWYGEEVTFQPMAIGDYVAGLDPTRSSVDCTGIVLRKADVERLMGERPGDKWGPNVAVFPITAWLPADELGAGRPAEGDRILRKAPPDGQPSLIEVGRVGDIRAGRIVLFCNEVRSA